MPAVLVQSNPATSLASLMVAVADARTCETLEPLVLHVREGQPLQLSVQHVQKMTWQELARIWKVSKSVFLSGRWACYNCCNLSAACDRQRVISVTAVLAVCCL